MTGWLILWGVSAVLVYWGASRLWSDLDSAEQDSLPTKPPSDGR